MCGITGIFETRERREISRAVLARMNESQHHRGPDEGDYLVEPGLGFGHRRLSIIAVATGQQPLFNEDGTVAVIYNGEIYNFQELIPELTALGHVFRTRSDTEVIVHAWEAWGEACVERFRGMFAFALWDRNRETLFLARDRLGVKPLYYAFLPDGKLIFGSELKSLLAHGGFSRELDPFAIEEYFALGYVPEPRTIFAGVAKLPPAHTLTVRRGAKAAAPAAILGCAVHARQSAVRGRRMRRARRAAARVRSPAPHFGGPARRLPVRRRRLEQRRRDDGRRLRRAGQHLLDRVRRPRLRRVGSRAFRRVALRHAALRRSRRERRFRPRRHARATLRRALCGQLGDSHLPGLPARAQTRHRRAVGRRRRRELRRLPALPTAPRRGAVALGAIALDPSSAVRLAGSRLSEGGLGAATVSREIDARGARKEFGRSVLPRGFHLPRRHAAASCSATSFARGSAATTRSRFSAAMPRMRAPTTRWH